MSRLRSFAAVALAALLAGCATLPSLDGRTASTTLADTAGTRLGRVIGPETAAQPGKTAIHPIPNARDAFATRALLAAAAEKSIDAQCCIWHGDQAGVLLFEALWQVAERGVRARPQLRDRLHPREPPGAQQVVHRGQPSQTSTSVGGGEGGRNPPGGRATCPVARGSERVGNIANRVPRWNPRGMARNPLQARPQG